MEFKFGKELFRDLTKGWNKGYFVKDAKVLIGTKLPLQESKMGKDLNRVKNWKEIGVYIYASKN